MLLIQKPIKEGDIVSLKLTSGEEVMARFDSDNDKEIVVTKPAMLAMTEKGPALAPFMMTAEQTMPFKLFKYCVVSMCHTDSEMAKSYLQSTTDIST